MRKAFFFVFFTRGRGSTQAFPRSFFAAVEKHVSFLRRTRGLPSLGMRLVSLYASFLHVPYHNCTHHTHTHIPHTHSGILSHPHCSTVPASLNAHYRRPSRHYYTPFLSALLMLLISNTTATHAFTYTKMITSLIDVGGT